MRFLDWLYVPDMSTNTIHMIPTRLFIMSLCHVHLISSRLRALQTPQFLHCDKKRRWLTDRIETQMSFGLFILVYNFHIILYIWLVKKNGIVLKYMHMSIFKIYIHRYLYTFMFVKYFSLSLEVNYCYIATKIASPQFQLTGALKCNDFNYSWPRNGACHLL